MVIIIVIYLKFRVVNAMIKNQLRYVKHYGCDRHY
jgi:hypothetical protein